MVTVGETMSKHLTVEFGQHSEDGYELCDTCGEKTMLICAGSCWSVDLEPLKAGEEVEGAPDSVEISEEVTGHYCSHCGRMTSLSFNG